MVGENEDKKLAFIADLPESNGRNSIESELLITGIGWSQIPGEKILS